MSTAGSRPRSAMTPLQKVAMGLVIVVVDAYLLGFDAVPDVLGWMLAVAGLAELRARLPGFAAVAMLAALSALVSLALLWPDLTESTPESTGWLLSLPQLAFSIALCGSVARLAAAEDPGLSVRFARLRWVFGALVVAPAVLYGGGVDALLVPVAVLTVAANVYLVYLLFKIARRPYALARPGADARAD